jgi:hypothetical protein
MNIPILQRSGVRAVGPDRTGLVFQGDDCPGWSEAPEEEQARRRHSAIGAERSRGPVIRQTSAQLYHGAVDRTVIERQQERIAARRQAGGFPVELEAVIVLLQAVAGKVGIDSEPLLAGDA